MKNILFVHNNLDVGGAEMMRLVLLRNIDRNKYCIKICCIGHRGRLGREIEGLGYKVDELSEDSNSLNPGITLRLACYIKKERPDILHSSLFNANFHSRLAGFFCGVPRIVTEEHGEHRQYNGVKFIPYVLSDFALSILNDSIVCCSERLRREIIKKEHLPSRKVLAIENCVDAGIYKIKTGREEVRKRHGISDEVVFITVASLKEGKGHRHLLEAFKLVKDAGFKFRSLFAGGGPIKKALQARCAELGLSDDIIFLDSVSDVPDYLNAADVFILPSDSEGLSISLMEAMLMGLPCIVSDVGSNGDLVKTDFNGIVVRVGDKAALRDAAVFYLVNKESAKQFGKRSESIIMERYSDIGAYVKKYYELWN
ncbi:MAG: glycosyltransferase [Candidatus Omnitrophica bacterium]|nr:glycosyltransferase [Candidatus Omnitrophota bacterium]